MPDIKPITYQELSENSKKYSENFPITANLSKILVDKNDKTEQQNSIENQIATNANNTYPILHVDVVLLIKDFLAYKLNNGNSIEKEIYQQYITAVPKITAFSADNIPDTAVQQFITRLLSKRPLMFCGSDDSTTDRPNQPCPKDRINPTEEYISYDEMQIGAFLGVSSPSFFINDGNRYNNGAPGKKDSFIEEGIIIGQVGARFERSNVMEYQHMLITREQNTKENGYGIDGTNKEKFAHWAKFYGIDHFPTYEEAQQDAKTNPKKYLQIDNQYLNLEIYKARMKKVIEAFLTEANARGTPEKKAYVHAVGLGLGVWMADQSQGQLIVDVYKEVLEQHKFENISDIDFSWFSENMKFNDTNKSNTINIHFTKNNPNGYGTSKTKEYMTNKLLVTQYAWDAGSFPGNEYWASSLAASGDPAAACCSQIIELQNPDINPNVCGEKARFASGNKFVEINAITNTYKTKHGSEVPLNADGKMHKYLMPFKIKKEDTEEEVPAETQANEMMKDFEAILKRNPKAKIAITYSANNNEAQQIISDYTTGNLTFSGGSNQGAVFGILARKIQENNLQNQIHILPVATSESGGTSDIVSTEIVKRDMQNIAKHLGAGWIVLGLRNQNTKDDTPCAIGGGMTAEWKADGKGKEQKQLCDAALTKMINTKIAELTDENNEHYYLKQAYNEGKNNPNALICEKPQQLPKPAKFKVVPDQGAAAKSPLDQISKELINTEQLKYWQEKVTKIINQTKYCVTSVNPTEQNDNTIATIASKSNPTTTIAVIKRDAIEYPYIKQANDPDFDLKYDLFLKFLNQYNNKTLYPNKVTITINNFSPEDLDKILTKLSTETNRSDYTTNVELKLPTTCQYTDKNDNTNKHYSQEQQQQIKQLLTTIQQSAAPRLTIKKTEQPAAASAIPTLTPIRPKQI